MEHDAKQALALWRLGVLGPLASARLEHGDRRRYFAEAAGRTHEQPDGTRVQLSVRTIEAWYYAYRQGGFHALFPRDRADRGTSCVIAAEIAELLLRVKRERPRRSIPRIIRLLERAGRVRLGDLHRSTVHRLLAAHGVSGRPCAAPPPNVARPCPNTPVTCGWATPCTARSSLRPTAPYARRTCFPSSDGATRYVPHSSYFAVSESAVDQEYGFQQAIAKHGPPRTYYQSIVEQQVENMSRLLDAVRDVSRASTATLGLEHGVVDLTGIIDAAVEACRPAMDTRGQRLEALMPDSPINVRGDAAGLAKIVGNLLDNASTSTPEGGEIELSVMVQGAAIVMTVSDSGMGIARALPETLDPLDLLVRTAREGLLQDIDGMGLKNAGRGIGLTVVRALVEAHGGTVGARNAGSGRGSQFIVTLPLAAPFVKVETPVAGFSV